MSSSAGTVIDAFERSAARNAERVAVWDRGACISYSELRERALRIAGGLSSRGIGEGDIVCVNIGKSRELISAMLGAWYAGAAYMPLDPSLPVERQAELVRLAAPSAVLVSDPRLASPWGDLAFHIDAISKPATDHRSPRPDSLAYVIFTSGSTGKPKGVMVSHAGLPGVLEAQIEAFDLRPGARSLFFLSMAFDASLSDIGTALLSGATLYIEEDASLSPDRLLSTIRRHRITYADLPPSLLSQLDPSLAPESLETIVIGGEVCPAPTVREWSRRVRLINVYGPTETTICASLAVCGPDWDRPSIGRPLSGIRFEIRGPRGEPAGCGQHGELVIAGSCVAMGYLREPELTALKFVSVDGVRWYRTGDLVRQLPDGSFEFLGRADRQTKIRGQLIEPAEIEARLVDSGKVTAAAVVRRTIGEGEGMVAFFVPRARVDASELRAELARTLPRWMIPSLFVAVDSLPLNHVGKIDLRALADRPLPDRSHEPPLRGLEERVAAMFESALGVASIGRHDDFFSMGGSSLELLRLAADATKNGLVIEPELLWLFPTVASLSARLEQGLGEAAAELSGRELERLSALDQPTLALLSSTSPPERIAPSRVLVTGAAGFFGASLLAELLERGIEEAVCIVRAESDEAAARRLPALPPGRFKVRALAGDLTLPRFGLSERVWDELCQSLDTVFHSAAEVSAVGSYAELEASNVGGTREVLRFALSGRPKEVHHISTLSVLLNADSGEGAMIEEELGCVGRVRGGYAQSKWVAERLLSEARRKGYDAVSWHRLGLITGHSSSGGSKSGDLLSLVVKCLVELGAAPAERAGEIFFDVTPADFAAKAVSEIAFSSGIGARGVFHITGRHRLSLSELVTHMRSFGFYVDMLPALEWQSLAASKPSAATDAALLALRRSLAGDGAFSAVDLFQATGVDIDATRAEAILSGTEARCPLPDERLVHRYLRELCREPGFFAPLPEAEEPPAPGGLSRPPPLGLTRADLYDAFLFKAPETPRILGFHLREIAERGVEPLRLLEIGCGTGRLLRAFSAIAENVDGMDPDEEYLARAAARCGDLSPRVSLVRGGFEDLEAESRYDIVTSVNGPFFYLLGAAEREDALRRIYRALVPGGLMIMDLANFPFLLRHYGGAISMADEKRIGDVSVSRRMSHRFDFHDSLWIHDDDYEARAASEPESQPVRYSERHVFAMMTRPEVSAAIARVGFEEQRFFEGWDSATPGRCSGARLLISARRPNERR